MDHSRGQTDEESRRILTEVDQAVNMLYTATGYIEDSQRKDIEKRLKNFKQMPNSWVHSIYFLYNSKNNYTLFYACSILENMLQTQWNSVEERMRVKLRQLVFTFLLERNPPHFVLTKLIKILIDIGKLDWPERYPDFLQHVLHTVTNPQYQHFGVLALQILTEEFTTNNTRQSVPVTGDRQRQLLDTFLLHVPSIVSAMSTMLSNIYGHFQTLSVDPVQFASQASQLSPQCEKLFESYQTLVPLCASHDANRVGIELHNNKFLEMSFSILEKFPVLQCSTTAIATINTLLSVKLVTPSIEQRIFSIIQQMLTVIQHVTDQPNQSRMLLKDKNEHYFKQINLFFECLFTNHIKRLENNNTFPMKALLDLLLKYTINQPSVSCFLNTLLIWEVFSDYIQEMNDASAVLSGNNFAKSSELYNAVLVELASTILQRTIFIRNPGLFQSLDADTLGDLEQWVPDRNEDKSEGDADTKALLHEVGNAEASKLAMSNLVLLAHSEIDVYLGVNVTLLRILVGIEKVGIHIIPVLVNHLSEAIGVCKPLLQPSGQNAAAARNSDVQAALHDLSTIIYVFTSGIYCLNASFISSLDVGFNIFKTLVDLGLKISNNRLFTRGNHIAKILTSILECITLFSHWLKTLIEFADVQDESIRANVKQYQNALPAVLQDIARMFSSGIDTTIAPAPIPILRAHLKVFRALVVNTNLTTTLAPMLFEVFKVVWKAVDGLPLEVKVEAGVIVSNAVLANCNFVRALNPHANCADASGNSLLVSYGHMIAPVVGKIGSAAQEARTKSSIDRLKMVRVRQSLSQLTGICKSMVGRDVKDRLVVASIVKAVMSDAGDILNICLRQQQIHNRDIPDSNFAKHQMNSIKHKLAFNIATAKDILVFFNSAVNGLRRELGVELLGTIINGIIELFRSSAQMAASSMTGTIGNDGTGNVNDGSMAHQLQIGIQSKNRTMILLVKSLLAFLATVLEEPHKALHSLHNPIYNLV